MGNNYMNRPHPFYGGYRYAGCSARYHGCHSLSEETVDNGCGCGCETVTPIQPRETVCDCHSPAETAVACAGQTVTMAYVPMQTWGEVYEVERGFCRGTLFPDLDKPFLGGRSV